MDAISLWEIQAVEPPKTPKDYTHNITVNVLCVTAERAIELCRERHPACRIIGVVKRSRGLEDVIVEPVSERAAKPGTDTTEVAHLRTLVRWLFDQGPLGARIVGPAVIVDCGDAFEEPVPLELEPTLLAALEEDA